MHGHVLSMVECLVPAISEDMESVSSPFLIQADHKESGLHRDARKELMFVDE